MKTLSQNGLSFDYNKTKTNTKPEEEWDMASGNTIILILDHLEYD